MNNDLNSYPTWKGFLIHANTLSKVNSKMSFIIKSYALSLLPDDLFSRVMKTEIVNELENERKKLKINKNTKINEVMSYEDFSSFMEKLFKVADSEDKSDKANFNTAAVFRLVADLSDVMKIYEKIEDEEEIKKIKRYCQLKAVVIFNKLTGRKCSFQNTEIKKDEINEELNQMIVQIEQEKKVEKNYEEQKTKNNPDGNNQVDHSIKKQNSQEFDRMNSMNLRSSLPIEYNRSRAYSNSINTNVSNKNIDPQSYNINQNVVLNPNVNLPNDNRYIMNNTLNNNSSSINDRYKVCPNPTNLQNQNNNQFKTQPYPGNFLNNSVMGNTVDSRYIRNTSNSNQMPININSHNGNHYYPNINSNIKSDNSYSKIIQGMINKDKNPQNIKQTSQNITTTNFRPIIATLKKPKVEDDPEYINLVKAISDLKNNKIPVNTVKEKKTNNEVKDNPPNNINVHSHTQINITPQNTSDVINSNPKINPTVIKSNTEITLPLSSPLIAPDFNPNNDYQVKPPIKFKSPEYIKLKEAWKKTLTSCDKEVEDKSMHKVLSKLEDILYSMTKIEK